MQYGPQGKTTTPAATTPVTDSLAVCVVDSQVVRILVVGLDVILRQTWDC